MIWVLWPDALSPLCPQATCDSSKGQYDTHMNLRGVPVFAGKSHKY